MNNNRHWLTAAARTVFGLERQDRERLRYFVDAETSYLIEVGRKAADLRDAALYPLPSARAEGRERSRSRGCTL